jgi:predicted ATPase
VPVFSRLPVRSVRLADDAPGPAAGWPWDQPVVARLRRGPLELGPMTVLVGENGTGKSTLVEAIALATGLSPEGGSRMAHLSSRASESPLHEHLAVSRGITASPRWGFFLRAETMHGFFTYLEQHPGRRAEPRFHEMSHGESFVALIGDRFARPGLYLLDEPESALSFQNCLALVALLHEIGVRGDSQVLVATHSPIVAALPGALLLELGGDGWRETPWEDLELTAHWRSFLARPERYLDALTRGG